MISLDEALAVVSRSLDGTGRPSETLPVADALGRTVVADQHSKLDLPPFDKSAMDGYAIPAGDRQAVYPVLETVPAGSLPKAVLLPGTAVKVMTGAPVPPGTGHVVKLEDVSVRGDSIEVMKFRHANNICRQGEDVRRGDALLSAGSRLSPLDVANLIGAGVAKVEVYRPVRVAVLSTGDEIADDPAQLRPGMIMNTNGPLLAGLARHSGLNVVANDSLRDDRAAIVRALNDALEQADLIVLSGGVSVGDFDFVTLAMQDAGLQVHFTALAVKPGRPTTYASAAGKAVFGLPGNPVSVYLMFHLFVLFAAARMRGGPGPCRQWIAPLACDFRRRTVDRAEYVPCCLGPEGRLHRVDYHGSAHLTALERADGFFVVPPGTAAIMPGEQVTFLATRFHCG